MKRCSPQVPAAFRDRRGTTVKFLSFVVSCLCAVLAPMRSSAGTPGTFENTGSLTIKRAEHTATLLPSGKVLVAGGNEGAELYDPASGTFGTTGSRDGVRFGHTATLLPNGKVLVFGGSNGLWTADGGAELYDASSGTWTIAAGSTPRANHTATLLSNGKVLLAGGFYNDFYQSLTIAGAQIYDPGSDTVSNTGNLAHRRTHHTATLLPDGKVLVAGGYDSSSGGPNATVELYDPTTGTWSATANLLHARFDHTATLLHNGKVLVAGGDDVGSAEVYDPGSGTWTATGSLAVKRSQHTATFLPDNKVLVAGGHNRTSGTLASAELYDTATGTWSSTGSLSGQRFDHTATLLPDNTVLIAGGRNANRVLSSAERYTPPLTPPALLNISTRLHIQNGDNTMIGGFIITGTEPKTVIVRGIGPSLNMPGALADPTIEVHTSSGELVARNDNWKDAATKQEIMESGLAPKNELESALWGIINPGAYTVVVRGNNDATGIGLFEVYDLDDSVDSKLANVSTRGFVQAGDGVLIAGVIVGGGNENATARIVLRALGPSIPVGDNLPDPTLELRDSSGTLVASNDNWKTRSDGTSQEAEIEATTIPPGNDLESALVRTLAHGQYSVIVRGKNNSTGVGLVEIYNLR